MSRLLAMVLALALLCPAELPALAETVEDMIVLTEKTVADPAETETPAATAEPEASPEGTEASEATEEAEVTAEPEATEGAEETAEPEATIEPEATAMPEATAEPEPTATVEATEAVTAEPTPGCADVPECTGAPESIDEPEAIDVDEIAVEDLTIGVKESAFLPLENVPEGVTLRFSSSNTKVCTVSAAGVVKGVAKGSATITVTPSEGEVVRCTVTVVAAPNRVTLNKTGATLGVGQQLDLDETITQGTSATITWSSSKRTVATVDAQGVVTAVGIGTANITVKTHNGKSATCKLTVKKAPGSITAAAETLEVGVGQCVEDMFVIPGGCHTTLTYKFASGEVEGDTSDFVRVEKDVLIAVAPGVVDVTATTHNGKSATVRVTVKPAPESIALSDTALTLGVKQSATLRAELPEGTCAKLTYTSNKPKVVKVDAAGKLQALASGTAVITVQAHNGVSATCTVTVKKAPNKITLAGDEKTLYVGMTGQIGYTLTVNTAAAVTWTSSNASVAEVSADGTVTAKAQGTATVTARTHNGKSDKITIYVYNAPTRLELAQPNVTLGVGQKLTVTPDTDAAHNRALQFASSDSAVVKISAAGALQAVKAGTATVSVATLDGSIRRTFDVTVCPAPKKVTLDTYTITMGVGDTYTINPKIPAGSATSFTYSRNSSRVSVSADGVITANSAGTAKVVIKAHNGKSAKLRITVKKAPGWIRAEKENLTLGVGQRVSGLFSVEKNTWTQIRYSYSAENIVRMEGDVLVAVGTGEVDLTATTHNGKSATVRVSVQPAPEDFTLSENQKIMGLNEKGVLSAVLPEGTAAAFTYTSSNAKVVKVDAGGNLQALRVGTATITVKTHNGVEKTCTVSVKKAPGSITLSDTEMVLYVGMTEQLTYTLPANTYARVTWSVSNASVAEISADGILTAKAQGTATITVKTHNGRKDTLKLYVYPAPTYMDLTQTSPMSMGVGQKMELRPHTDASHYRMLEFSSSNSAVVKVSASGHMRALKAGTATVTVRTLNDAFVRTLEITVYKAPGSLKLSRTKITMGVGETYAIEPVMPENTYGKLTYTVNNSAVAVSEDGIVTARTPGTAKVTVATHNGKKATLTVTVTRQPESITLSEERLLKDVGDTVQMNYQLTAGTMSRVTWTSANTAVCTVDDAGVVTCVGVGKAVITATTSNGKTDSCEITVVEPAVRLEVVSSISLHVGETYELEIDAETASGAAYQGNVTITPGEGDYVQIINGNVYGVQKGSTTLTVRASSQEVVVQVTVLSETNDSRRDIIVSSCLAKLGCPYVYANHGPDKFDCSGLVYYGYKQVGITLKYSAYAQGYQEGVQITKAQLLPGDIVCFNTNATDSDLSDHTGIYIGDGKFVHASSSEAKVIISDLTTGYYERTFSWGRRILQ